MFDIYDNIKNLCVDAKRQAERTVYATNKSQRQDKSAEASGDIYVKKGSCGQAAGIAENTFR